MYVMYIRKCVCYTHVAQLYIRSKPHMYTHHSTVHATYGEKDLQANNLLTLYHKNW